MPTVYHTITLKSKKFLYIFLKAVFAKKQNREAGNVQAEGWGYLMVPSGKAAGGCGKD